MKKCCFIIPYYGKLPAFLPIFLKSCEQNPNFNWLLFTDDRREFSYPENVRVVYNTFDDFRALAREKFGFSLSLERPYKLCDLKPAYGFLFEEYLSDFAFWGCCDLDTIMGRLEDFLTDALLDGYDKIFCLGHMTLYRNTPENNRVFMCEHNGEMLYQRVFTNPEICWFDEEYKDGSNVNRIFLSQGKRVFQQDLSMNVYIGERRFRRIEYVGQDSRDADAHGYRTEPYRPAVYFWDRGQLLRLESRGGKLCRQEFAYMHLQYRKMRYRPDVLTADVFQIVPNRLVAARSISRSSLAAAFTPKSEALIYRVGRAARRMADRLHR